MRYEFEKNGVVEEREYPMGEAPKIGERTRDGWTRIVSKPRLQRQTMMRHTRQRILARTLHRKGGDPENPAPHYTPEGVAAFDSDREIREFCARSKGTKNEWNYDASVDDAIQDGVS